jgi:hypothetical protein
MDIDECLINLLEPARRVAEPEERHAPEARAEAGERRIAEAPEPEERLASWPVVAEAEELKEMRQG